MHHPFWYRITIFLLICSLIGSFSVLVVSIIRWRQLRGQVSRLVQSHAREQGFCMCFCINEQIIDLTLHHIALSVGAAPGAARLGGPSGCSCPDVLECIEQSRQWQKVSHLSVQPAAGTGELNTTFTLTDSTVRQSRESEAARESEQNDPHRFSFFRFSQLKHLLFPGLKIKLLPKISSYITSPVWPAEFSPESVRTVAEKCRSLCSSCCCIYKTWPSGSAASCLHLYKGWPRLSRSRWDESVNLFLWIRVNGIRLDLVEPLNIYLNISTHKKLTSKLWVSQFQFRRGKYLGHLLSSKNDELSVLKVKWPQDRDESFNEHLLSYMDSESVHFNMQNNKPTTKHKI